ncbi:MAG TPA: TIGR04086 family membrane protein [Acidimicrobiales bacterium]|jgi:putative membrane protein (TIGR04086 family)
MSSVDIDWRAVVAGAIAALVLAVPAGVISAIVVSDDSGNGVFVFYVVIIVAMLLGGFVAGSKRPDAPLTHGALAAAVAYAIAQTITVVVKLIDGTDVRSPAVYVFNLLLMASIGVVGGFIAERRNARVAG